MRVDANYSPRRATYENRPRREHPQVPDYFASLRTGDAAVRRRLLVAIYTKMDLQQQTRFSMSALRLNYFFALFLKFLN